MLVVRHNKCLLKPNYAVTTVESYSTENINIAFARGGAHLPIAHALRLLSTQDEIEIEKK